MRKGTAEINQSTKIFCFKKTGRFLLGFSNPQNKPAKTARHQLWVVWHELGNFPHELAPVWHQLPLYPHELQTKQQEYPKTN
ncbi:hypothetical protein AB685_18060 [Bacillus sp. LL01]|nr:hypothetical protein AB685_18060 [Bacillus sp. LL01]